MPWEEGSTALKFTQPRVSLFNLPREGHIPLSEASCQAVSDGTTLGSYLVTM